MSSIYTFRPIVKDQYTAARSYFLCVIGLLFVESMLRLPAFLLSLRKSDLGSAKHLQRHWTATVWLHKLSTLPSLVPFLTHHIIPSIFRCLVFTGLNFLWGWNRIRYSTDYQLYGWLTIANAGLALLFPTRTNLFSTVARIPSPILLMYHRWAGVAATAHASLHFGLTAQSYIRTKQFDVVLENIRIRVGIMAWAALALMFLTSIRLLRRRTFELFYYTHFIFLVFIGGALYHAAHGPEFLLPGLVLWAIDRIVRFWYNFRGITVKSVTQYSGNVTKIQFEGAKTVSPGQIAWVQIPSVSLANWHPFTIASAPGDEVGTIAVRALGGYTKKVQQSSIIPVSEPKCSTDRSPHSSSTTTAIPTRLRLDGPYGVGRIEWMQYPVIVLVAGGIGITPGISIASHVVKYAMARMAVETPPGPQWHIHLLWTVSDTSHARWFEDELINLAEPCARPNAPVSLDVTIHVTSHIVGAAAAMGRREGLEEENGVGDDASRRYNGPGEVRGGRPNVLKWFQRVKEARAGLDAAVNICGPRSLMDDARRAAAAVSCRGGLFYVEDEEFEF
ncbi:ferric reductase like transmembrane component-domain-containing protein [Podospora didyma]|uniref:Ferric reductase like transmembrane component-domain-containing protein n=1 Tax=Podospora didyma TaxID=330526 RepID=A0AAE0NYB6_9PEZI|nr:ferric reductase like transmembrane component-domain-containing protein [Podospora didyma]